MLASLSIKTVCGNAFALPVLGSDSARSITSCTGRHRIRTIAKGFGDELLDYITAGPKLRKWYGEGEKMPVDGGADDLSDRSVLPGDKEEGPRDAILVTDANSPTAEQVVLQLILSRAKVRALVKNTAAASTAYGSYITPLEGNTGDLRALEAALRGVRTVICTGRLGHLLPLCQRKRIDHLIVLTSAGAGSAGFSLEAFLDAEAAAQRDKAREAAVLGSGLRHTLVRVGRIVDAPGGASRIVISQDDPPGRQLGQVSREDVAKVLVCSIDRQPVQSLAFCIESGRPNELSNAELDLEEQLARLQEAVPAASVRRGGVN